MHRLGVPEDDDCACWNRCRMIGIRRSAEACGRRSYQVSAGAAQFLAAAVEIFVVAGVVPVVALRSLRTVAVTLAVSLCLGVRVIDAGVCSAKRGERTRRR